MYTIYPVTKLSILFMRIITTAENYSYSRSGWNISIIMDELSEGFKRKVIKEERKK